MFHSARRLYDETRAFAKPVCEAFNKPIAGDNGVASDNGVAC
jgi:hypothetical protein